MTLRLRNYPRLAALALLPLAGVEAAAAELPFDTAAVETARAPLERVYDGTVEAVNKATMSAQTSGRIAEVYYDVDDYVEPGDPIVRFTDREQEAALSQAEAALAEALARQNQAAEEFTRAKSLFDAGSSSKREYDQAVAARDAAAARVQAARSAAAAVCCRMLEMLAICMIGWVNDCTYWMNAWMLPTVTLP